MSDTMKMLRKRRRTNPIKTEKHKKISLVLSSDKYGWQGDIKSADSSEGEENSPQLHSSHQSN